MWRIIGSSRSCQRRWLSSSTSVTTFDFESISKIRPFPSWLAREMRSNHAGETGAVYIYKGCLSAVRLRQKYLPGKAWHEYEMELTKFASEHEKSEQHHLDLLNKILTDKDTSILLPLWKLSGFTLGFASTIWCPRGMYVTTEAVETFVERHYKDQIHRLENETSSNDSVQQGRMELKRLLEFCCEDEIHHQQEARDRAAQGPFPWFLWVDTFWFSVVEKGSAVGAAIAKRV